jgi:hypothetical protein
MHRGRKRCLISGLDGPVYLEEALIWMGALFHLESAKSSGLNALRSLVHVI